MNRFLDDVAYPVGAFLALVFFLCSQSKGAERPSFTVEFTRETTVQEIVWQAANVIDTIQTVQIAKHPGQYSEVGTISYFAGNHPSVSQAIGYSALFAVLHYGLTLTMENVSYAHPGFKPVQRVIEYSILGRKLYTIGSNYGVGLRP